MALFGPPRATFFYPRLEWGSELVANGGGETGSVGSQAPSWNLVSGNELKVASDEFFRGSKSLKIINASAAESYSEQGLSLIPGLPYELSAWIKTDALPTADAGYGALIECLAGPALRTYVPFSEILSSDGDMPSPGILRIGLAATGAARPWRRVRIIFRPLTTSWTLFCKLGFGNQSGTAWFDEVSVRPALEFQDAAQAVAPPGESAIAGQNLTADGTRETLFERFERLITLRFAPLQPSILRALRAWAINHAALGKQSSLYLDWPSVPPACTAEVGAAGNVNTGTHSWYISFLLGSGETKLGAKSNIVTAAPSQISLKNVPLGPLGTTARRIWRTVAGDTGSALLVAAISDNTTTTYTDNVADASLSSDPPQQASTGQYEYDEFNDYFTKAELLTLAFGPARILSGRALYGADLTLRQGT